MRKLLAVILVFGIMLSGCVYVDMEIENKPEQGIDFSQLKDFGFIKKSESRKEVEEILLKTVKVELEAKGFKYNQNSPDFFVMVNFNSRGHLERGVTYKRDAYEYDFISKKNSDIGVVKDGDVTRLDNTVRVSFITQNEDGNRSFLWRGKAASLDLEGIEGVGNCLVKGALEKFPAAEGRFRAKMNIRDCK